MSGGCCEVCGGRCAVTYHLAGLDPHQCLREECVVLRRGGEVGREERWEEGEGGWGGKGDRK